jgi:AbiV family abortive infection protein
VAGSSPDWAEVHEFLRSHHKKLMANLMNFKRLQSPVKVPRKGTAAWEDAVARVKLMDGFKQDGLYVSFREGSFSNPDESFDDDRTEMVLQLAKTSFNTSDLMGRGFDAKQAGRTQVDLHTRYS